MQTSAIPTATRGLTLALHWRRLRFVLIFSGVLGLLISPIWVTSTLSVVIRAMVIGLAGMLVFGLFEQWPRRLPDWLARWVLQVAGVALAMPMTACAIYVFTTEPGAPPFWQESSRLSGFFTYSIVGMLLAPWAALGALVRQKDAIARHQALAFDLERSELERQALDARLNLLQAQVAPHFLFNTLANVQALVESASPQAPGVLKSLIAYLRAAVPRLDESATTLGQELKLVRAYLELMKMRMPDRLAFALHVDEATLALCCPPMTLLTLVENAVRHGIDPSEDGGRIDVHVERHGERCTVRVIDTGAGLQASRRGLGTGLVSLRERLQLIFGDNTELRISEREKGVVADVTFPARGVKS